MHLFSPLMIVSLTLLHVAAQFAYAGAVSSKPPASVTALSNASSDVPFDLIVPVRGVHRATLRNTYLEDRAGHTHEALDIPARRGTPVLATAGGRVVKLFKSVAGGLTVYQFDATERYAFYYAHLDRYADNLREGMTVAQGDVIAFVGASGNAPSDAPHLHFAIFRVGPGKEWWKGMPVNPYPLLRQ